MPGRNRKNRGPNRNDFRNSQTHDQAPNNRPRPPRPFGPISHDGPRRRSHGQTHILSSGIHRPNDNSNPGLSSRFRNLKQQSNLVKQELEALISQIDDLQPDAAAMDWAGSAGTIVYVPITRAADGSFQHAQMISVSSGEYPNGAATFRYAETVNTGANDLNRPNTPVAFTPYAESMRERISSSTTIPPASRSSTVVQAESLPVGGNIAMPALGRTTASTVRDSTVRSPLGPDGVIRCAIAGHSFNLTQPRAMTDSDREDFSAYQMPEMSYRGERAWSGTTNSSSNLNTNAGGQRANQALAAGTGLKTPPSSPPSPVAEDGRARYEGLGM
jgi:hypothetical protein